MNKIYKVIWSKVKGCYVVASEFATRNGKTSGHQGAEHFGMSGRALTLAVCLAMGAFVSIGGGTILGR